MQEHSVEITLTHPDDLFHLFGSNERHLRLMEQEFGGNYSCPDRNRPNHWRRRNLRAGSSSYSGSLVLVNRGMTIGTPDGDRHYHGEKW